MEFDYTSVVLALIVFSLMLMVIRLRFEVRHLKEELDRLAEAPRYYRSAAAGGTQNEERPLRPSGDGDEQLRALVAKGRKIEAIKEARQLYNLSLKDAKDYVESL
ncbi:ribosomal L7/L12 family protein [Saccharibacillus alkalitolerans]|uniref:Large ribosomal subunit protein bL12 C-terminal domain-containing protein n=1 Tax=Saccharibacillus alkalitolerans TaxID=2705290 RepID=A0ABX0FC69_9BACL|nr:ribosomal protein L7/L12 [Saccharibacillus alkalitolerans]NGZ77565.1 hypothetical protein [Saccharibacillus alkalitolerans]